MNFNYLFPRVKVKQESETFQFLTETEINQLTNEEYKQYKYNLSNFVSARSQRIKSFNK